MDEIEGALAVHMACTHTAAMLVCRFSRHVQWRWCAAMTTLVW